MKVGGKIAMSSGMISGNRAKRRQSFHALVLGTVLCVAPLSAAVAQTTVNAGDITAMPGGTASVPISIVLPAGTQCSTVQFKLTVVANGTAPAVATQVTYTASNPDVLGSPGLIQKPAVNTILIGYVAGFTPVLATGTTQLGTLNVPIPTGAQPGQTYTVQVLLPSGTTDGSTDLPMTGVNATITIGGTPGPTNTQAPIPTSTPAPTATAPSVNAGAVTAMPGDTAAVPISIVLPATGAQCSTVQFKLTVVANDTAPAVATQVTYTASNPDVLGSPGLIQKPAVNTILIGYVAGFTPVLTATTQLGTLNVPIPTTAQAGQTYTVEALLPSGTTDGSTDLPMSGVNGTITIGGAPTPTNTATHAATSTPTNTGGIVAATPTPTRTPIVQPTSPPVHVANLTAPLTASLIDNIIHVDDITNFPDSGKIMIDQEIIRYNGIQSGSGTAGNGGGAATAGALLNAIRGADGTTPAAHTAGTAVLLFQPVPVPSGNLQDSDGCSIGMNGSNGRGWLLVIPAVGLLVMRRRKR